MKAVGTHSEGGHLLPSLDIPQLCSAVHAASGNQSTLRVKRQAYLVWEKSLDQLSHYDTIVYLLLLLCHHMCAYFNLYSVLMSVTGLWCSICLMWYMPVCNEHLLVECHLLHFPIRYTILWPSCLGVTLYYYHRVFDLVIILLQVFGAGFSNPGPGGPLSCMF